MWPVVIICNMLWLYLTHFNGLWFTVIVTLIALATVGTNRTSTKKSNKEK